MSVNAVVIFQTFLKGSGQSHSVCPLYLGKFTLTPYEPGAGTVSKASLAGSCVRLFVVSGHAIWQLENIELIETDADITPTGCFRHLQPGEFKVDFR